MILISVLTPAIVIVGYGGPLNCPPETTFYCLAQFGRVVQFLFIAIAGMLPGLLYFLFDRQRLGMLRKEVERDIFRLDPSTDTLADVEATYGQMIEEFYGSTNNTRRLVGGTRVPILVATAMLSVGLIMAMLPVGSLEVNKTFELYALLFTAPNNVFTWFCRSVLLHSRNNYSPLFIGRFASENVYPYCGTHRDRDCTRSGFSIFWSRWG